MYCSGKDTVKNILLFNILIYLFSSRNSPNLLTDLCTSSRDGCCYSELEDWVLPRVWEWQSRPRWDWNCVWVDGHVDLCQFSSACACNLVDWSMSLLKSRKRSYRYRVKCEECEKEFDFDYVEAHSRIVHSGRKVKCLPVVESSQLKLSGFFSKSSAAFVTIGFSAPQTGGLNLRGRNNNNWGK